MDRIKDMLVETIEDFRNEVGYDCRFENVFDELLVNNDSHKIIIKGDIKSFISKAIENCDREIAFEQDSYIDGDYDELCTKTLSLYINLKKDLIKLQNDLKEEGKNSMSSKLQELFDTFYAIVEPYIYVSQSLELDSLNNHNILFTNDGTTEVQTFEECIDDYIDFSAQLSKDNIDEDEIETAQACLEDIIKLRALKEEVIKATESPYSTELREFKEYVDNKVGELIESEELDEYDLELKFCDKKLNVWISPEMLEDLYELIDNQIELY